VTIAGRTKCSSGHESVGRPPGGLSRTDLRAILYLPGDQYKAEIFVQNLEDEDVVNNIVIPAQTLGGPTSQITLDPPRTFGIRLSADIGG
jgi:hypothetical protein